jgi:hypothetical protein
MLSCQINVGATAHNNRNHGARVICKAKWEAGILRNRARSTPHAIIRSVDGGTVSDLSVAHPAGVAEAGKSLCAICGEAEPSFTDNRLNRRSRI